MQNRDRLFYQYALLNLAVLQADFGCFPEAIAAIQETISTARENKDMGCLNFSLSWLYHFGTAHPKTVKLMKKSNMLGVEREGLAYLRVRAKECGMWSLWSSSLLSEAKLGLSNGESVAIAFENILRSSQLSMTKGLMNSMGSQVQLQSSLWSRLGVTRLAWGYCEIFLACHAKHVPFDDILKFTCRSAYMMTQKGLYDQAMAILDTLDTNSLRSLKSHQFWLRYRGILKLKRDLHHNNLDGADRLLAQLLQGKAADLDLTFELSILQIDLMMRRNNYSDAYNYIERLAAELNEEHGDLLYRVRLLTLKALLHDKCGRTQSGFSVAVRAATIAWQARLLPALWHAMGAIANILTSLGEFVASAQILASVIPRALECEDCELSAQLFFFMVDAHVGMAGHEEAQSAKRTEYLTKALEYVDRTFEEFSKLEDMKGQCETTAKKATLMYAMGDFVLANDYAAKYLALKREAEQDMHQRR